jgi:hypothetical protein
VPGRPATVTGPDVIAQKLSLFAGVITNRPSSGLPWFLASPKEFAMPEESSQINPLLHLPRWWIGDPFVVLESILNQVEGEQRKQIATLYLDSVTATLDANLKFVQGVRSVVAGAAARR